MIGSHGCAGRAGRAWLLTALALSGPLAVNLAGPGTAGACHITPRVKPREEAVPAAGAAQHATGHPVALSPTSYLPPITPPPALTPSPTSPARPVVTAAAQQLPTATPTVETWSTDHPTGCTPPPPPCTATPPIHHGPVAPPSPTPMAPRVPPAALEVLPTPEPSTALIAVALAGAFAWRRRRGERPGR